jgi:hypothetical protein
MFRESFGHSIGKPNNRTPVKCKSNDLSLVLDVLLFIRVDRDGVTVNVSEILE